MDVRGMVLTWLFFFTLIGLIFFIGKAFSRLAINYDKNKLLYLILGILVFSLGVFLGSKMEMIVKANTSIHNELHILAGYIRLPIGLLICWAFYRFLKNRWIVSGKHNKKTSR